MKRISLTTLFFVATFLFYDLGFAKSVRTRKVQEVNFSEMNLKGTIRNPDGAYLVQKKGLKFQPLYKVQESIDLKIREASLYID
jgi:hypothetical protein